MARFEGRVPLDVVVRVARESETDLYASGAAQGVALAELVERKAEKRLAELVRSGLVDSGAAGEARAQGGPVPAPRHPPA